MVWAHILIIYSANIWGLICQVFAGCSVPVRNSQCNTWAHKNESPWFSKSVSALSGSSAGGAPGPFWGQTRIEVSGGSVGWGRVLPVNVLVCHTDLFEATAAKINMGDVEKRETHSFSLSQSPSLWLNYTWLETWEFWKTLKMKKEFIFIFAIGGEPDELLFFFEWVRSVESGSLMEQRAGLRRQRSSCPQWVRWLRQRKAEWHSGIC